MIKPDKLRERISFFITSDATTVKVPQRVVIGFKIQTIADTIQNMLGDKFHKKMKYVDHTENGGEHIFNYVEEQQ